MEKPTASQSTWVSPFKNSPLPVLKEILNDAMHLCRSKTRGEHLPDVLSTLHRRLSNLMVYGVCSIEGRQRIYVGAVKRLHPRLN